MLVISVPSGFLLTKVAFKGVVDALLSGMKHCWRRLSDIATVGLQ